jgi:hypothetical protein
VETDACHFQHPPGSGRLRSFIASAIGYTSHLLAARVQFLVEMILVEVTAPIMSRPADPGLYDVPRLVFRHGGSRQPTQ